MVIITSRQNPLIAETAKLKEKKYREEKKSFLFEGIKLTREAIANNIDITHIFLTERCAQKYPDIAQRNDSVIISESVCSKLSENYSPEGIICTANYMDNRHNTCDFAEYNSKNDLFLILYSIQDPGNLGTIMRASAAFGKKNIILSSDCADIYNQKTIRASMGAVFRTSTCRTENLFETINSIKKTGKEVYAAALQKDAKRLQNLENVNNCCFVLGNEGHGISKEIIECCSGTVIIPMEKDAESLNVSSAASVILWEAYRQI